MNTTVSDESLRGKLVAVAGATGSVGEGIARSLLRAGARVVALGRDRARLDRLRTYLDGETVENLVTLAGDASSFAGFRALARSASAECGAFDHAVASIGRGFGGKPVWDVTEQEFDTFMMENIKIHFAAARALAPVLTRGGSYTFVAGLSALLPLRGASIMGMRGGAQLMLAKDLQADAGDRLRVNTLALGPVVSRNRPDGMAHLVTADDAGRAVVRLASSTVAGQLIRADDKRVLAKSLEELGLTSVVGPPAGAVRRPEAPLPSARFNAVSSS